MIYFLFFIAQIIDAYLFNRLFKVAKNKVLVTGLGVVCSGASCVDMLWNNVVTSRVNAQILPGMTNEPCKIGYVVENDENLRDPRLSLHAKYALSAANEAIKQSKINLDSINLNRGDVIMGTGFGSVEEITNPPNGPYWIPQVMMNNAAAVLSKSFKLNGGSISVGSACASGSDAIGAAYRRIRDGHADFVMCGGSEAATNKHIVRGFTILKALCNDSNENPSQGCRPFDESRNGFVLGSGAGVLILESEVHASKRHAQVLAEITGYGCSNDAYQIVAPLSDGSQLANSMRLTNLNNIEYVNLHGTSTKKGDLAESAALGEIFKNNKKNICVSSTKAVTGHCLGAAGAIEAIITIMSLMKGVIPCTTNLINLDEKCAKNAKNIHFVKKNIFDSQHTNAMSLSAGFGGHNSAISFKKV
eukprot:GHVL01004754.1.p1 GENE.GHVL01004754.1~~GHVL01004754.1.p1  ORF type:complete len:417 (+),score=74.13 GHVL01004754.1:44-1294(+)